MTSGHENTIEARPVIGFGFCLNVDLSNLRCVQIVSEYISNPVGTTQLRCIQPAKYLRDSGFSVVIGGLYSSIPEKNSIIIIHRAPLNGYTRKFIRYARLRGSVIVYDTDDLLFDPAAENYFKAIGSSRHAKGINASKQAMLLCDVVQAATRFLVEKAKSFHPDVRLLRNGLNSDIVDLSSRSISNRSTNKKSGYVTVAYLSGSGSHDRDFQLVEGSLLKLLREYPQLKVLLAGRLRYSKEFELFDDRFEFHEFMPYEKFQRLFFQIDINLVPLEVEQDFCQAKSELKYIEAGIFGIPSVVSPTHVHQQAITNDVNGRLVKDNDWYGAIEGLLNDEDLRMRLGIEARKHVMEHYSAARRVADWRKMITNIWDHYGKTQNNVAINFEKPMLRASLEVIRWSRRGRNFLRRIV